MLGRQEWKKQKRKQGKKKKEWKEKKKRTGMGEKVKRIYVFNRDFFKE